MNRTSRSLALLVIAASLLAACGDETASDTAEASPDLEATEPLDDTEPADETEPSEDTEPTDDSEPPEAPADAAEPSSTTSSAGSGTATVEVGEESFDFRVIQCLRDVPGLLGGVVTFQLDGVPTDAPSELVEPLMGVADPDSDIFELMAPVLEYGPLLSVTRLKDGGDYVAVSLGGGEAYVSDGATSGDQYLAIGDEPEGAAVAGETTVTTEQDASMLLSLVATCP